MNKMTDTFTKQERSQIMAKIKNRNTKPEAQLKKILRLKKIKYVQRKLPGKPDFVLPNQKIAVFVDGCFWHKCPRCFRPPKSNKAYWSRKIKNNVNRDDRINIALKSFGWQVVRILEHEIKKATQKRLVRKFIKHSKRN